MEQEFVQKYAQDRPQLKTLFGEIYNEVVGDLITEVRQAEGLRFEEDTRFLRMIAAEAVYYAREFTRERSSPLFEARRSIEAARQVAQNAPRRRRRKAASGKKK